MTSSYHYLVQHTLVICQSKICGNLNVMADALIIMYVHICESSIYNICRAGSSLSCDQSEIHMK